MSQSANMNNGGPSLAGIPLHHGSQSKDSGLDTESKYSSSQESSDSSSTNPSINSDKKNGPSASQATKSSKLQPLNEEELADQPRYETTRIFTHKIAYSMPKELKASQQEIDQILQTAVEFTVKSITKVPEEERDWDTVVRSFSENSLVIQRGDEHRNDSSYKPSDKNKWQGTNRAVIQEVKSWFNELISDSDVLQDKGFDFDSVAELVATAGKDAIAKLEVRDNSDDKYREASIIEYGILRYPLPSKPYFRTYSIQLFAWTQISSRLFGLKNESQSGIRGTFRRRLYDVNEDLIKQVQQITLAHLMNP